MSPGFRVENSKNIWNHQLLVVVWSQDSTFQVLNFKKKKFNVEVYTPWNWQSAPGNALYYMDYSLNKKSLLEKQYELLGIQLAT